MTDAEERTAAVVGPSAVSGGESRAPETADEAAQPEPPAEPDLRDPALFLNRELSLLKFQARVLDEARDPRNPLLERLKFLGIVGSNLGEFFMVRIAGLKQQVRAGVTDPSGDGRTPAETLAEAREGAFDLMKEAREVYADVARELWGSEADEVWNDV